MVPDVEEFNVKYVLQNKIQYTCILAYATQPPRFVDKGIFAFHKESHISDGVLIEFE